jgi:hypothetical protein
VSLPVVAGRHECMCGGCILEERLQKYHTLFYFINVSSIVSWNAIESKMHIKVLSLWFPQKASNSIRLLLRTLWLCGMRSNASRLLSGCGPQPVQEFVLRIEIVKVYIVPKLNFR